MSIKPRTIDNLPLETSNRYAKDQAALDRRLIDDSRLFPGKPPQTAIAAPYIPADHEERFSLGALTVWAAFAPPPDNDLHASRLFSYQMVPSLGGTETLQAIGDKLESLEKAIPDDRVQQYEYQSVSSFVKRLIDSSRTFDLIRARCNQYQRG